MIFTSSLSKMALKPLNQKSSVPVREQTVKILREAILNFELRPGQRLVEREFINRLGISRTTFREALRQLSTEGLVTVVARRGARVTVLSTKEAADLYEVRSALEALVITRFVERASDEEIAALENVIDDFDQTVRRTNDTLMRLNAKDQFYRVLLAGARSDVLDQVHTGIKARMRTLCTRSLTRPGRPEEAVLELRAVTDAIARRDASLAQKLNDQHIRAACLFVLGDLPRPLELVSTK
jgi:DNA-binding GntR family transcriptional regulator